jgi:hypothetical protein
LSEKWGWRCRKLAERRYYCQKISLVSIDLEIPHHLDGSETKVFVYSRAVIRPDEPRDIAQYIRSLG